jgi:accessory gene regulator protein AgrB
MQVVKTNKVKQNKCIMSFIIVQLEHSINNVEDTVLSLAVYVFVIESAKIVPIFFMTVRRVAPPICLGMIHASLVTDSFMM